MDDHNNIETPTPGKRSEPAAEPERAFVEMWTANLTPFRLMIVLALSIFLGETVVMLFLSILPPLSMPVEAIIDGLLIAALSFPLLYFLLFRPLILYINERKKVQEALRVARDELEVRVRNRTTEISEANALMKKEMAERRRAEEALRESENNLRLLSNSLLTAQETERKRISHELHDELGQALTVLKLQLRSIEHKLREDQETLEDSCAEAQESVDRMIEDLRRLSQDLSPAILEDLGLSAALSSLIENFSKHSGMEVSFDARGLDEPFPEKAKILIYRIFQEALSNIVKHADASNISVKIDRRNGKAVFVIEDDGQGFDLSEARLRFLSERGMGLATMDERARMMGGELVISSEKSRGTKVALTVPVMAEREGKQ